MVTYSRDIFEKFLGICSNKKKGNNLKWYKSTQCIKWHILVNKFCSSNRMTNSLTIACQKTITYWQPSAPTHCKICLPWLCSNKIRIASKRAYISFRVLLSKRCLYMTSVYIFLRYHYLILQGIPIFSNCRRQRGGALKNKEGYCDRWNIIHNEYSFHPALSSRGLLQAEF